MKKLISLVTILSLFSTFALSEMKIDGKIGLDIGGSHKSTLSGSIDLSPYLLSHPQKVPLMVFLFH
jgi:hypothetical protein